MALLEPNEQEVARMLDMAEIRVLEVRGGHVKLGFDAPRAVSICRSELRPNVRHVLPAWQKAECA